MKFLFLTWKDLRHPLAGGAEVVNEALARQLVVDGHEVTFLVGGFTGAEHDEMIDGYRVIRVGGRFTVYLHAYKYYKEHLRGWADVVIDEVNTIPFFAKWYAREPVMLFIHQLARKIWFYQMPWLVGALGYIAEPLYLRLLKGPKTITVSESTRRDLMRHGFRGDNIHIISEGIEIEPLQNLRKTQKFTSPTILSLGAIRPMKQTLDQVKAFEKAKEVIPELQMKIAGDAGDSYGQKVLEYIAASSYAKDIEYLGRVSHEAKIQLMQKAHLLLVTSVKEGWGLVVTEAASQGTPAVVYDVDGLRDSVQDGITGVITAPQPAALALGIEQILQDSYAYEKLRTAAWEQSKQVTFKQSYQDFKQALEIT